MIELLTTVYLIIGFMFFFTCWFILENVNAPSIADKIASFIALFILWPFAVFVIIVKLILIQLKSFFHRY